MENSLKISTLRKTCNNSTESQSPSGREMSSLGSSLGWCTERLETRFSLDPWKEVLKLVPGNCSFLDCAGREGVYVCVCACTHLHTHRLMDG